MSEEKALLTQTKWKCILTSYKVDYSMFLTGRREFLQLGPDKIPFDYILRLEKVVLTDRHLILFHRYHSEELQAMQLPLERITQVQGNRGFFKKPLRGEQTDTGRLGIQSIDLLFLIPQAHDEPNSFRLRLGPGYGDKIDMDTWFRALSRIGGKPPPAPPTI